MITFDRKSHITRKTKKGITEAFVHAVLDARALQRANAALVALGAAHAAASLALVRARGAVGLIAADALNMALRIALSLHLARGYFSAGSGKAGGGKAGGGSGAFKARALLPSGGALAALAAAGAAAAASERALLAGPRAAAAAGGGDAALLRAIAMHVAAGAAALAVAAVAVWRCERATLAELLALRRGGRGRAGGGDGAGDDGNGGSSSKTAAKATAPSPTRARRGRRPAAAVEKEL